MFEFFRKLLGTDFMPHGYCMRWSSDVVALHVTSDLLTALSYYMIPVALVYFARRRKDLAFHWMFVLFSVFILACGTTHLMAAWTLWNPMYRLDGVIKGVTALASLPTAILLIRLVPRALAIPGPGQWKALNDDLSRRVDDRTSELRATIQELHIANERLRQTNADLEQFAYAASHDLQEPLRMVSIYSQLVERAAGEQLNQEARGHLKTVHAGAIRMHGLVQGLLQYSLAATSSVEPECVKISDAIEDAMHGISAAIEQAGAAVVYSKDLPGVFISRTALDQVLQNMIGNALKYRSERPPEIRIDAEEEPAGSVLIRVKDNGIGIDPAYHKRIFGVFKRLHGGEYPGTGIGLALCKRIVERNGGEIWVESAAEEGSVFLIRLRGQRPVV
jgi:signal transduction histidine kinase